MRIVHIDTGEEMRGGQWQVLLLLEGLRTAGHESILLAREDSPLWNAGKAAGFTVRAAQPKELWQQSRKAAIVHAHDARAHTMAAIAARKFVVSRRVAFPVRKSVASIWKYQRATRFLAVSQFVARQLQSAGIRKEKIDVVYDGVETPSALAEHWTPDYPAVALASEDVEKGRDLVEEAALITQIRVVFSETLRDHLRRASMFVYITRSEGLGSAVLLAMSMGVPVIASSVGGLTEVFADGISGIFVKNEAQEIASAMRRVLSQPADTLRLIAQAKARIAECFTRDHLVNGTIASYERALAG